MAKTYLFLLLALATLSVLANDGRIIAQSPGSITFEVDENLKPVDGWFDLYDGEQIAKSLLPIPEYMTEEVRKCYRAIATSFFNENNFEYQGESPFYGTLIKAYARHMSVTLSPDMIWLLISQGFARYVNAHAEQLRSLFVDHDGKMALVVQGKDFLFEDTDWPKIIGDIASQIEENTKGDIAQVITADFSTTGPVERVASQITLMESVKSYFTYEYITCGIPSITLKGTPEDWQRVLEKTQKLSQYGLDGWVKELEPILTEFILAAEGHPNQHFWQCIVMTIREDILRAAGGGCGDETEPTVFDGWFLKLYPDEEGKTSEAVEMGASMPSEMVHVEFKYDGEDMELWAGFIATEVDSAANMLTPKIGWMVVKSENIKLYFIKEHWPRYLCLAVVVVSILGLIVWIIRKVIKSRKKRK
jgi:hypothetical protein